MRPTRDQWAMDVAKLTACRSTCCRRNVGCVILNARGHVLATGYNGVAAGLPHCNDEKMSLNPDLYSPFNDTWRNPNYGEMEMVKTYPNACSGATSPSGTNLDACEAIHAEQNALLQCKSIYEIDTIYVTASPCVTCTKLLLNTSCRRVVYLEEYPHSQAKDMWIKAGREWHKFDK
jgi:dCMP deaminase